jgi:hypothetical protein
MNYYTIIKLISDRLKAGGFKTVTFGEIDEVDIERQNIFPLAHIVPETSGIARQPFTYSFTIVALDLVLFPKGNPLDEVTPEFGQDNTQDVLADIHFRLATFAEYLRRGADDYEIGEIDIDPFKERWESLVAGWTMSLTINAKNYASIC